MKKNYMLIIITSTLLGVCIGISMKEYKDGRSNYLSKYKMTKTEIKHTDKDINKMYKEKEELEKELKALSNRYEDSESVKELEKLKYDLSYTDLKDKGISIKVDLSNEEVGNIANIIDYNKILVKLINEIKMNGGKFIAINNQRINQYSEVVLAGSHININSNPIAPPYDIKVIGDTDKLDSYVEKGSQYINNVQNNYPIKIEMNKEKEINLPKISIPNKLKYVEGE